MVYKDTDGTQLYDGDIVIATEHMTKQAIGRQVLEHSLGVFCASGDNKTARVAWTGYGLRFRTPFSKIRLYEPKSLDREAQ